MPLVNFSVFQSQVEAGLRFEGDYWKMAKYWMDFPDAVPSPVGLKRQTIRAIRKYPFKVGDKLYLYTGCRTKKVRKLGEATAVEVFTLGMNIDPSDLRPYPFGGPPSTTVLWEPYKGELSTGGRYFIDVEELAILDGFNKYPVEWGIWTEEDIEKYKGFLTHYTKGVSPKAGVDKYLMPGQVKNAVDMLTWFSKAHGDKQGKLENKFFQVIRW
jgi:hypothetical protein